MNEMTSLRKALVCHFETQEAAYQKEQSKIPANWTPNDGARVIAIMLDPQYRRSRLQVLICIGNKVFSSSENMAMILGTPASIPILTINKIAYSL
jgi:hypothetical protein